ncbi:MAG TPA: class I SAM-dependent methyltransferase [Prolixibacteraceae bacterium]|nr:class I SAM-dependent methyltransferase [Prolixibacteraceae bacterium]
MEKQKMELGAIQKTLLFPLWGRAIETKKEKPLLMDHTAVRIMESLDDDFSSHFNGLSVISQLGWVVRSMLIDQIIVRFLQKNPNGTIVDIGCGLDTTFERMDNGTLRWYDLDMPDTIELRRKFFQENERRTFLSGSFLDEAWLETLPAENNILFVSAGVFYYYEEKDIKLFFRRIAQSFPGCEIAFDASSPFGIKMANKMVLKKGGMGEDTFLKWGIRNAKEMESWDDRLSVLSEEPFFKDIRTNRDLKTRLQLYFSDKTKMQYLIHVKVRRD